MCHLNRLVTVNQTKFQDESVESSILMHGSLLSALSINTTRLLYTARQFYLVVHAHTHCRHGFRIRSRYTPDIRVRIQYRYTTSTTGTRPSTIALVRIRHERNALAMALRSSALLAKSSGDGRVQWNEFLRYWNGATHSLAVVYSCSQFSIIFARFGAVICRKLHMGTDVLFQDVMGNHAVQLNTHIP